MDGKEPESVSPNSGAVSSASITPVVKHNTKSACKIQHPGLAG